jgi:TonB family protein
MLAGMAAAVLAAPVPTRMPGPDSYPSSYLGRGISAAAFVEMVVDVKGKVESCRVLKTIGNEAFANSLCAQMQRSRWKPARDADGQPLPGVVRSIMRMFIPGTEQGDEIGALGQGPDLEVAVVGLPDRIVPPFEVKVSALVDDKGAVTACEPRPDTKALGALACERVRLLTVTPPVTPLSRYATELNVHFIRAGAAKAH